MDTKHDAPPALSELAEQWTGSENDFQAATGEQPGLSTTSDLIGIDLPGVGLVPACEVSSDSAGRERAVEVGERSPDLDGVHEMSLRDRFRAAVRREGEPLIEMEISPLGVAKLEELAEQPVPDFRAIAGELLGALYTMIGKYGMPLEKELAAEIRVALEHAEAAKVEEVPLG